MIHTEKHDIPEHGKKVKNVAEPSAGTTTPASKVTGDIKNDALGCPGRYNRAHPGTATEKKVERSVIEKQLGSNKLIGN